MKEDKEYFRGTPDECIEEFARIINQENDKFKKYINDLLEILESKSKQVDKK